MRDIAVAATFPARAACLASSIASIARQVDELFLILNEFSEIPKIDGCANVKCVIPPFDLKDTGKFFANGSKCDDFIFLCDDDIIYPEDYVFVMKRKWLEYEGLSPIIGVHGVNYSDFFDGDPGQRIVHLFTKALAKDCYVNQLGTGTVLCRGYQMPEFEFMRTSSRFVDLRFACHAQQKGFARICVARTAGWMKELPTDITLFESFTTKWNPDVVREAQEIAGFQYLRGGALVG